MKILEINSVCGIKSTGRICTDLADVLKDNGHIVAVAYGRENVPEKYKDSYFVVDGQHSLFDGQKVRLFDDVIGEY